MTSRECLLKAMQSGTPDHLSCSLYFNPSLQVPGYNMNDWKERARLAFDLGTAPVVYTSVSIPVHPDVATRAWLETGPGQLTPILFKEYRTPSSACCRSIAGPTRRGSVSVFGKTGFILGVTNSIRNQFPWENTPALVDEWKEVR